MIALVRTVDGAFALDVEDELVLGASDEDVTAEEVEVALPRLVAASAGGAVVVALVDRRPPLLVSGDGGITWREAGGGLPAGFAVAIDPADPDRILYAARNRLYLSTDGGRFWREPRARAAGHRGGRLGYGILNSPRATVTAEPPTSTNSIPSAEPVARA